MQHGAGCPESESTKTFLTVICCSQKLACASAVYKSFTVQRSMIHCSLGSRPPPFRARLNYAHAYAANIRRTGKAWAETSREGRRGVDAWRCGT